MLGLYDGKGFYRVGGDARAGADFEVRGDLVYRPGERTWPSWEIRGTDLYNFKSEILPELAIRGDRVYDARDEGEGEARYEIR